MSTRHFKTILRFGATFLGLGAAFGFGEEARAGDEALRVVEGLDILKNSTNCFSFRPFSKFVIAYEPSALLADTDAICGNPEKLFFTMAFMSEDEKFVFINFMSWSLICIICVLDFDELTALFQSPFNC
jgi:hypothetical protein